MVDAITLDFYGTLVRDDDQLFVAAAREVAEGCPTSTRPSPEDVATRWYRRWEQECEAAVGARFQSLRLLCRTALAAVVLEVGSDRDLDELLAPVFDYWRRPELFPDARDFLAANALPVCIVSDVDRDDLTAALAHHDLHVDHVVTSEDVRAYKPRPAPFHRALEVLGANAHDVVHVGDSPTGDVLGARRAGLDVVWVNRGGRRPPDVPAMEIRSLSQLSHVLTI